MLTKVSLPNKYATINIQNYITKYPGENLIIDKIQDNMEGWLGIKYKNNSQIKMYNYYLNRFYSHDRVQIHWDNNIILKQIDSFDQNNFTVGNKLRTWVSNQINHINLFEFILNSILGIGGEYYLYWIGLKNVSNLIGISNHHTIVSDANHNIGWSQNYLVDYNKLDLFPQITYPIDLVLINLAMIHTNIVKYISKIQFKKIILIICNLPDSKLKLLNDNFTILKIKYFRNYDNLIRVVVMKKKYIGSL
jgi:hypothetical protein